MRYHVLLDGSAGPDVECEVPPTPDQILEIPGGGKMRVRGITEGGDGTSVIHASRVDDD